MNTNTKVTWTILSPALLAAMSFGQNASFTGLGFLNPQDPWSECTGISDDGLIVSGHSRAISDSYENQGFFWMESTGMIPIGNPPLIQGSPSGRASDISGDGLVMTGKTKFNVIGYAGFTWHQSSGFLPLKPMIDGYAAESYATNGDGSVSVGQSRFGGYVGMYSYEEGTVWLPGQADGQGVGLFPSGPQSTALGVSRDGTVVVGEALRPTDEGQTAFRWDQTDGFVSLGDLPGGYHFSRANAANEDGSIIVGYGTASFSTAGFNVDHRACYWDSHGVHELPNFAGSSGVTEATDISPDGRFIVGWARHQAQNVPVIWDDVHGIRNLYEIMASESVDVSTWDQGRATAVSADGKTIVGQSLHGSTTEAWVCRLP